MNDDLLHETIARIDVRTARLEERVEQALSTLAKHDQDLRSLDRKAAWLDGARAAGAAMFGAIGGVLTSHVR